MYELKDCPFCGGTAKIVELEINRRMADYDQTMTVMCIRCGAKITKEQYVPPVGEAVIPTVTVSAVDLWNERATETKTNAALLVKWIDAGERLPDDEEMKIVACKSKNGTWTINRAYYMGGCWHGSGSMANVTHWMPLPKTPDEVTEQDEN